MNAKKILPLVLATLLLAVTAQRSWSHCQVPCGIYDDPARFVELKEHATTIDKATAQITELAGKDDVASVQQVVRWVNNKEIHAAKVQQIALDYFLAQRIKIPADESGHAAYHGQLGAVHAIIVHAMKCKQTADPAAVAALSAAIEKFEGLYGK